MREVKRLIFGIRNRVSFRDCRRQIRNGTRIKGVVRSIVHRQKPAIEIKTSTCRVAKIRSSFAVVQVRFNQYSLYSYAVRFLLCLGLLGGNETIFS